MAEVIFHSSGSTGAAKAIIRSEESLQEDARRLVASFPEVWGTDSVNLGTDPENSIGDRPLVMASVQSEHMYGALWRVRVPAIAGFQVEKKTAISVEELIENATFSRRLIFVTTPSFLEKAVIHPDFVKLRGFLRAIVTSGSSLRRETALAVQNATGVCPLEIYGSTEAGTVAWRRRCDGETFTLVPDVSATLKPLGTDPISAGTDPVPAGTDPISAGTDHRVGLLVVDSPYAMARPLEMGDLVEMVDDRHFILKGRADRRVKILERYVSLSEVETALAAHPSVSRVRVESYGEAVPRLGALIVLTDEGRSHALRGGTEAVAAELRKFLMTRLDGLAVPRRIRFVRELPANAQGKTTAGAVRAALAAWCREPVVTQWRATADKLEVGLVFPADMECFRGHFPGFPILPGVAQLYFLRHFARQAFPDWPDAATCRKLKFQKIIRPGVPVTMMVSRQKEGAYAFEFVLTAGRSTSGIVEG